MKPPPSLPWACLGGVTAPPGVAEDLQTLASLPEGALAELWTVLGPSLRDQLDPRMEQALTAFARQHGAAEAALAHGLKAARYLVRESAKVGAGLAALRADLSASLGPERGERLFAALEPRHVEAVRALRYEIVREALVGHGAVYLGASWRADVVTASEKGQSLATPVALVTLRYRHGAKDKALTLQALPEDLARLRDALDHALGAIRPAGE